MTNGMQDGTAAKPAVQPTPERFFNALNAHQQTEAMKAAIELEVFTAIAEGKTTAAAIAERCAAAERGVRILCDFLAIHGFLTKENQTIRAGARCRVFSEPTLAGLCRGRD